MTYEPQTLGWQGLRLGAGVVARGQQQGDNTNTFQVPGYAVVNLMAGYGWKVGPSKVSLQLNVDNLLDKIPEGAPYSRPSPARRGRFWDR